MRKVTLGTSLFLPSWMPASNQPDDTSVICIACLRSTGLPQAEKASADASRPENEQRHERPHVRIVAQNWRTSTFWRASSLVRRPARKSARSLPFTLSTSVVSW